MLVSVPRGKRRRRRRRQPRRSKFEKSFGIFLRVALLGVGRSRRERMQDYWGDRKSFISVVARVCGLGLAFFCYAKLLRVFPLHSRDLRIRLLLVVARIFTRDLCCWYWGRHSLSPVMYSSSTITLRTLRPDIANINVIQQVCFKLWLLATGVDGEFFF